MTRPAGFALALRTPDERALTVMRSGEVAAQKFAAEFMKPGQYFTKKAISESYFILVSWHEDHPNTALTARGGQNVTVEETVEGSEHQSFKFVPHDGVPGDTKPQLLQMADHKYVALRSDDQSGRLTTTECRDQALRLTVVSGASGTTWTEVDIAATPQEVTEIAREARTLFVSNKAGYTAVGSKILRNSGTLSSVIFDKSCECVKQIGRQFLEKSSAQHVYLASLRNVESIGESFMGSLRRLVSVSFTTWCGDIQVIPDSFLVGCQSLEIVNFGQMMRSVREIGESFMEGCSSLVAVHGLQCAREGAVVGENFFAECNTLPSLDVASFENATFGDNFLNNCMQLRTLNASGLGKLNKCSCHFLVNNRKDLGPGIELPLHFDAFPSRASVANCEDAEKYFNAVLAILQDKSYTVERSLTVLTDLRSVANGKCGSKESWRAYLECLSQLFAREQSKDVRRVLSREVPEWLSRMQDSGVFIVDLTTALQGVVLRLVSPGTEGKHEFVPVAPSRVESTDWFRVPPSSFKAVTAGEDLYLCYYDDCNMDVLRTPSGLPVVFKDAEDTAALRYKADPVTPPELWDRPFDPCNAANYTTPTISDPHLRKLFDVQQRDIEYIRAKHNRLLQHQPPPLYKSSVSASPTSAAAVVPTTDGNTRPLHPPSATPGTNFPGTLSGASVTCEFCKSKRMNEIDSVHKHMESARHVKSVMTAISNGLRGYITIACATCNVSPVEFKNIRGMRVEEVLPLNALRKGRCTPGCNYVIFDFDKSGNNALVRNMAFGRTAELEWRSAEEEENPEFKLQRFEHTVEGSTCAEAIHTMSTSDFLTGKNFDQQLDIAHRFAKDVGSIVETPLDQELIAALHIFTQPCEIRDKVNGVLRDSHRQHLIRPFVPYIQLLLRAMGILEISQATKKPPLLRRRVASSEVPAWKPGDIVTWWSFTSAVPSMPDIVNMPPAVHQGKKCSIMMDIACSSAVDIGQFSATKDQPEYLLFPGIQLRAGKVEHLFGETYQITFEEISRSEPLIKQLIAPLSRNISSAHIQQEDILLQPIIQKEANERKAIFDEEAVELNKALGVVRDLPKPLETDGLLQGDIELLFTFMRISIPVCNRSTIESFCDTALNLHKKVETPSLVRGFLMCVKAFGTLQSSFLAKPELLEAVRQVMFFYDEFSEPEIEALVDDVGNACCDAFERQRKFTPIVNTRSGPVRSAPSTVPHRPEPATKAASHGDRHLLCQVCNVLLDVETQLLAHCLSASHTNAVRQLSEPLMLKCEVCKEYIPNMERNTPNGILNKVKKLPPSARTHCTHPRLRLVKKSVMNALFTWPTQERHEKQPAERKNTSSGEGLNISAMPFQPSSSSSSSVQR